MLKKIKIKNSTILLIGIIVILIGISLSFYEYFVSKKQKAFTEMNVMLYENEIPENIEDEKELEVEIDNPIDNEQNNENTEDKGTKYNYIGILEIPKINLKNGFLGLDSKYNNVDYNITVIKGSTFPDTDKSNLILAAHSGICPVCYFENLYNLVLGDYAYIYYNNIKYTYKIVDIYEVEKDGTVAIYRDYTKSGLTLITCTRNSDTKQTVYILDMESKEEY